MDGNNSLKRIATDAYRSAADTRSPDDSDYFLHADLINRYANEVRGKSTKGPAVKSKTTDSDDDSEDDLDGATDVEGDPTDGVRHTDDGVDVQATRRRRL